MELQDLEDNFSIFAIDPSNTSCGWAVFDCESETKTIELDVSGDIRSSGSKDFEKYLKEVDGMHVPVQGNLDKGLHTANDWVHKCDFMLTELSDLYEKHMQPTFGPTSQIVVIELPWGAGQRNVDDIMKLMFLVGTLRDHFSQECYTVLAPVLSWKGQAKKDVNLKRMNRRWGLDLQKKNYDEADAIGIGTWYGNEILGLDSVK